MRKALHIVERVAKHNSPVLLTGATGTGKEVVARMLHRESPRATAPFVPVNCGGVPEQLLESEFFGYAKGAFTGADRDKEGLFEAANQGTLFLDEVGELPGALQVKLLRALQEGEVRRLGSTEIQSLDVRVISATNLDLEAAVEEGNFREGSILPFGGSCRFTCRNCGAGARRSRSSWAICSRDRVRVWGWRLRASTRMRWQYFSRTAGRGISASSTTSWERALVLTEGPSISIDDLPEAVRHPAPDGPSVGVDPDDLSVKRHGARLEKHLIQLALDRTGGNKTHAAELLELSPRALRYKIQEYGVE